MNNFLLIETATDTCSVAVSCEDRILAGKMLNEPKSQASKLVPLIDECLKEAGIRISECTAVSVSKGPGSYTGLRVGVSTAKGLCFGKNLPLIGIDTLEIIAREAARISGIHGDYAIIPMIDARRMEVYTATYDVNFRMTQETRPVILDEASFAEEIASHDRILFAGNGTPKFRECLAGKYGDRCIFIDCPPTAMAMAAATSEAWNRKRLEDVAYFEPFYLKDFIAGISKKSVLP